MNPYIKIIRPINCLMSGISILVVAIILYGLNFYIHFQLILIGFAITFLVTAGGNIINDYYDAELDKINHPKRPIPSGLIKRSTARNMAIYIFIAAFIISIFTNYLAIIITVIAILLLYSYEYKLKNAGISGNVVISLLVMALFIFAGVLFDKVYIITFFALMAFFSNLGREIIKDVEDVKGDINRKTLPKKIGIRNSNIIALGLLIVAVSISPIPYALGFLKVYYLIIVIIADIIFLYAAIIQFKDPRAGQTFAKYAMIVGLLSYVIGGIL
ncbi:MAG: UbiA family prenyltransferase [Thermoplasmata archaeon]